MSTSFTWEGQVWVNKTSIFSSAFNEVTVPSQLVCSYVYVWSPWYSWNIAVSGIKHQKSNQINVYVW